jgi:signal transduction histidine kinase
MQTLAEALNDLLRDLGQCAGITASCTIDDRAALLTCEIQDAFYRVGQEALTNVVKHARARHVTLSLVVRDGLAQLEVCDDGVGIAATGRGESGQYGIQGMRERVEALGGALILDPCREGGTILRASIPTGVHE